MQGLIRRAKRVSNGVSSCEIAKNVRYIYSRKWLKLFLKQNFLNEKLIEAKMKILVSISNIHKLLYNMHNV